MEYAELKAEIDQYNCSGRKLIKLYREQIRHYSKRLRMAETLEEQNRFAKIIQDHHAYIDRVERELREEKTRVSFRRKRWWQKIGLGS